MALPRPFADLLARLRAGVRAEERARLTAILELNRALAKADDQTALLTTLLDEAIALFGAERGFVVVDDGDGDGQKLRVEVARSLDRETVRQPGGKISRTIAAQCMRERKGVFCADAREGDFGAVQSVADLKLRSVLCMPLLVGESCLGCVYLDHRFQSDAFGPDDVPWLAAFADQAAIAVRLHRLLAENRAAASALRREKDDLALQVATQVQELAGLKEHHARDRLRHAYPAILGEAPALLEALHLLDRVVDAAFPVLLQGESGTGKELFARALHAHGPRREGPLVAVNVAAIADNLLESELFGHVRGAFTGADRTRKGLLREADGGVLFLDEIAELGLDLQVSCCASFAVVTIDVPPLRARGEDVPLLVEHFLREAAAAAGRAPRAVSAACLEALRRRPWPGNVRQLRNEVLRLDALATGEVIEADLLSPAAAPPAAADTLDLAALERRAIAEALRRAGGNKTEAARLLGISRRSLYDRLGE